MARRTVVELVDDIDGGEALTTLESCSTALPTRST